MFPIGMLESVPIAIIAVDEGGDAEHGEGFRPGSAMSLIARTSSALEWTANQVLRSSPRLLTR
jgi:hypothetical protein